MIVFIDEASLRQPPWLKRQLGSLRYERLNRRWELAECEHHHADWAEARRCIVARRLL